MIELHDWRNATDLQRAIAERRTEWLKAARANQLPPTHAGWTYWLLLAGRGFGKTRTAMEDAAWYGVTNPEHRIALVAATAADARDTIVEGESGLLSCLPDGMLRTWNRSLGELVLVNDARYKLFSGEQPDRLRGPQHHRAYCFIAGTMIATPDGERPIEMIRAGDMVLTRKGPRRVRWTQSRVADVGEVRIDTGDNLVATPDHTVYTPHGWTRMDQLESGATVCVIDASNGVASAGTATRADITSAPTSRLSQSEPFVFIAKCGAMLTATFRPITTFITKTRTFSTTRSAILNAFRMGSIEATIARLNQRLASFGATFPNRLALASTAARPSCASAPLPKLFASSASASGRRNNKSQSEPVCIAGKSSEAIPATIAASVASTWRHTGRQEVFCLKVEGEPEFFANGVLVHNCDELAAWEYPETFDQLLFGLRLGQHPKVVIATTPKPTPIIRRIAADPATHVTRGSTFDNAPNLARSTIEQLKQKYEGTRLGRQELYAEVLDDVEGALWTRAMIDKAREKVIVPQLRRIVVAVDPSGARNEQDESSDEIGIVVAGKGVDGRAYVLSDRSCRMSPLGWARRAVEAYHEFKADLIIGERNFGGAMIESTIRTVDPNVKYEEVVAARGKVVRAEPVASVYEQGRVSHVGSLQELEDQMCLMTREGYMGDGSPDRVDALVWAINQLLDMRPPLIISENTVAKTRRPSGMFR